MSINNEIITIVSNINNFPKEDKNQILELLEHDEWGIALEIICSVIHEENLTIDVRIYNKLEQLGKHMELDSCFWQDIRGLIK